MKKIAVIGTGQVGQATAQQLARENFCSEIALIGRSADFARGIALDIQHALPLYDSNSIVSGHGSYDAISDADIVVLTAGVSRKPGMSRMDLLDANVAIVDEMAQYVTRYAPNAILIIVTNPVDVLTYRAWQKTGWSRNRVLGLSCILDSARMASLISLETGYSVREVSALVIGGHGDAMVPLPRFSSISGIPVETFLAEDKVAEIVDKTRLAGGEIVSLKKMSGFIAAAASTVTMLDGIINNRNHILPCVAVLQGEYGYDNIALGVPTVLGGDGVTKIVELPLNANEMALLVKSAEEVKKIVSQLSK